MRVLIVSGGNSAERKISLLSASQVKKALERSQYRVRIFNLRRGFPALRKIAGNFDVIFPVIHGEEGEGGKLQRFLATLSQPYVGGDWQGFKAGWYKIPFKKFCDKKSIPTAEWRAVKHSDDILSFGFPSVLKSSSGGSSQEVIILKSEKDLRRNLVSRLFTSKAKLYVEKFLDGIEVTAAILNNQPLPLIEIRPPQGEWFSYRHKYSGKTQEFVNAPSLSPKVRILVQKMALRIHHSLKLGHYSRIDFIVVQQTPYALEVNTIPGLTATSLFPKAAQATGLSFKKLVRTLVSLAMKNHRFTKIVVVWGFIIVHSSLASLLYLSENWYNNVKPEGFFVWLI